MSEDSWSRIYQREENIVSREIAGETILVPIRGKLADMQNIFTLNTVGAYIWDQLDGINSLAQILDSLLDQFEVDRQEAEEDILEFIDLTAEKGLTAEK
jgi:hypothetical protein